METHTYWSLLVNKLRRWRDCNNEVSSLKVQNRGGRKQKAFFTLVCSLSMQVGIKNNILVAPLGGAYCNSPMIAWQAFGY